MAENNNNSGNQTQIIVALIGLVGVVTTALLGNWDKVFPSVSQPQPSPTSSPLPSPVSSPATTKPNTQEYERLESLLSAQKFKEAEQETRQIILQLSDSEGKLWADKKSMEKVSCEDIRAVDQLWQQYSNNKFGFTVQKGIFQSVERNTERFGDLVGWRKNGNWLTTDDLNYSLEAPKGHLPSRSMGGKLSGGWLVWYLLSDSHSKAASCLN